MKAERMAMLMKLQSYVRNNGGINEDVMFAIDANIARIINKLSEDK